MKNSALQTVQQYQQLMGSGDEKWMDMVADDITFAGPVDQVTGKKAFAELNASFFPQVKGYELLTAFEQGNQALLESLFTVQAPGGKEIKLKMAEIYEVENGKINNIRIYYDAEEFRKEFS